MFDLIKKAMFTGLGVAYMTKEKIEELARDLTEKGKLSEKEGKEFVEELKKKSEEARKGAQEQIEKVVNTTLKKMNVATQDDLQNLEKKMRRELGTPRNER